MSNRSMWEGVAEYHSIECMGFMQKDIVFVAMFDL